MDEGYTGMKMWPIDTAAERTRGQDASTAELREAMSVIDRPDTTVRTTSLAWLEQSV